MTVEISFDNSVKSIMTDKLISITPDTILTEIAMLFEENNFHHLPVLDKDGKVLGIVSKSDFHQLQHHFTKLGDEQAKIYNEKLFKALLVSDIMTKDPILIDATKTIKSVLHIFLGNKFHSILVLEDEKCIGIITPYDIIKYVVTQSENT